MIHEVLKKHSDVVAKYSIKIMIQLYKRGLWNDVKTVNIIAGGCFNEYYKIKLISCYFLMETTIPNDEFSDESDVEENIENHLKDKKITKKTKAKMRVIDREKKK
jgi:protein SDA1